jgi:uncharacterized protein DUF732
MDLYRITHPLRLAKRSHQPGSGKRCAMKVISYINRDRGARGVGIVGMAVLAVMALGADPVANANSTDFLAAVQGIGVIGVGPATLEAGYDACDDIWQGGYTTLQAAAAAVQKNYPTLTSDQAISLLNAAYQDLCPTAPAPGKYDWWAYSNGSG